MIEMNTTIGSANGAGQATLIKPVIEYLGTDKPVNRTKPLVSVCITAYQHAKYIEQCLSGAIAQNADFPYEVLVGEDDSNDGTREICKQFAEKYPDKIRLFLHERANNYLIAGEPSGQNNFVNNLREARGEFLAFCDGDDFWTQPDKIQRQVKAMADAPQSLICFHKVDSIHDTTGAHEYMGDFGSEKIYVSAEQIVMMCGSAMPLNSIMLKEEVVPYLMQPGYEASHFLIQALGGALSPKGAVYLPEVMSCYRKHSSSSITQRSINTSNAKPVWTSMRLRMLDMVGGLAVMDLAEAIGEFASELTYGVSVEEAIERKKRNKI